MEFVENNDIRANLIYYNKIGNNKSIKSLNELDIYPGNTWYSGCEYFINSPEVDIILSIKIK
jgi:hypothetical protein